MAKYGRNHRMVGRAFYDNSRLDRARKDAIEEQSILNSYRWYRIANTSPIAFWMLDESGGTTVVDYTGFCNGLYNADVSTFPPVSGGVDGKTWPTFSGNDRAVVYSPSFSSRFNGREGTILIYGKVDGIGRWTDAASRRLMFFQADVNNNVHISKGSTNNYLTASYRANGSAKTINIATNTLDTFSVTITWSYSRDRVRAYFNGSKSGADLNSLGQWSGSLCSLTRIGAFLDNYTDAFIGNLGYCAVWNRELTASEIAWVATPQPIRSELGFSDEKIRFVWTTDTHVVAGQTNSLMRLAAGVNDANTWRPNAFVNTGDIGSTVDNTREGITQMRMCHRPFIACNGNHDEEEITYGYGKPNTEPLYEWDMFNRRPFYYYTILTSGNGSVKALCIVLDNNIYDHDPSGVLNSAYHQPGDRYGMGVDNVDRYKRINPECMAWIGQTLERHKECNYILVFVHHPPTGPRFTNWAGFVDLLQSDGRPAIGFCGHVHANATSYTQKSTDQAYTFTVYKMPSTYDSSAFTRVTLGYAAGVLSVDSAVIYNFVNPGGWTISAPFSLAP